MLQLSIFDFFDAAQVAEVPVEVAPATAVASSISKAFAPVVKSSYFRMSDDILAPLSGPAAKVRANMAAIETAISLRGSSKPATEEQRRTMASFTGWGGLSEVFAKNSEYAQASSRLAELLSPSEYAQAQDSVLTAYYTEPEVIRAMWQMVRSAGFAGGAVIEPSCGNGHFVGCMPDDLREASHIHMVEIDPLTATMAVEIYADDRTMVRNCGIEDTSYVGCFDLVIGNIPFGNYRVSDRRLDRLKLNIHEYFVAKSLDMVRPGGLVALITTASMMDKADSSIKRLMLQKSNILSIVRLPSGAFKRLGGTDVLTDIVLLQKRSAILEDELVVDLPVFSICQAKQAPGQLCCSKEFMNWQRPKINAYFADRPEQVLGKLVRVSGRFGSGIGVSADDCWQQRLGEIAHGIPKVFDPAQNIGENQSTASRVKDPAGTKSFVAQGFFFADDGRLMRVTHTNTVESQDHLPGASILRIEGMTRIRDCVLRLMEADAGQKSHAQEIRAELNALYDGFVSRYGYLLSPVNRRLYRSDSHAPLLWSLEFWDDESEQAKKADIFTGSTVSVATLPEKVESIDDAIALSYNKYGRLEVSTIAVALDCSEDDVVAQLLENKRVFLDPLTGQWVDSLDYLSGNVRLKLQLAKDAAVNNQSFEANVKALDAVQPPWISLSQVAIRLGVPWMPANVIEMWLKDTLRLGEGNLEHTTASVNHVPETASWTVECNMEKAAIFKSEWGTARKGFWDLLRLMLNQQTPEVYDEIELPDNKTKRVINRDETLAAQAKAEAIGQSFEKWLVEQDTVRHSLECDYNLRYNGTVNRTYDGSHMMIPGLNPMIKLRDAQKDSIWRGIVSGNTLYALAVGGGKTLIQICVAQESKRLGIANKPVLVVPNHMLEAFAGEYLRAFPRAKVLAASKDDFEGEGRKTLLMRAATGNWDCIIVTHSTFGRIGLGQQTIKSHANTIKERAREAVLGISDRNLVREASRAAKAVETKLESLMGVDRDSGILPFEDLGIDMILVDEADLFKNLFFFTKKKRIPGIASAFSSRALDLFIKSRVVFERRGDSSRGLMFSTATPISNSIAEMFIMQTYLQEDRLRELDIDNFDAWSANFAREVTCVEVKPEGSGYRLHTRFARFVNVPELMLVFREIAEIRTKKMLALPEPKLYGGGHEVVVVPPSQAQKDYVQELVKRAEDIRSGEVTPDEDNMLCVTGDGRKAALDMRCVNPNAKNDPTSKVNVCADKVFEIWERTKEQRLTQLVFCDLSVPNKSGFSVYQHLKDSLIAKGIPEQEIAFAQDWDTDSKKAKLHRLVRSGQIRVLIGSTELMGFGTNVQDRLVAKHDLDAPWRPRDVEQRDGRIIRQGNMNEVVHIFRYVTEQTFDAYMWQTLERKASFIAQVMENDGQARSVEDVTSQSLSFAEVKALASGNPIVIEKAAVDAEVAKLMAIKDVHEADALRHKRRATQALDDVTYYDKTAKKLETLLSNARWDVSSVNVRGIKHASAQKASEALMDANKHASEVMKMEKNRSSVNEVVMFESGNLIASMRITFFAKELQVRIADMPETGFFVVSDMPYGAERIEKWLVDGGPLPELAKRIQELKSIIAKLNIEAANFSSASERVFEHAQKLSQALQRQAEIDEALEIDADDKSALALSQD